MKIRRAGLGRRGPEHVEPEDGVDEHDEDEEPEHVEDGGQTFEYLPQESSHPAAVVRVGHKQHPQSSRHPEMRFVPDDDGDGLGDHHHQRHCLHHGALVPEEGSPADPARLKIQLHRHQREAAELDGAVHHDGDLEDLDTVGGGVLLDEAEHEDHERHAEVDNVEPSAVDKKVGGQRLPVSRVVEELVVVLALLQEDGGLAVVDLPRLARHLLGQVRGLVPGAAQLSVEHVHAVVAAAGVARVEGEVHGGAGPGQGESGAAVGGEGGVRHGQLVGAAALAEEGGSLDAESALHRSNSLIIILIVADQNILVTFTTHYSSTWLTAHC